MKKVELIPHGWPCKLKECSYGLFLYDNIIGVKVATEDSGYEVYEALTGRIFKAPESDKNEGTGLDSDVTVSPCILEEDDDSETELKNILEST